MKFKFLLTFLIGGATLASAQGFKDGIQYFRAEQPEEAEIILTRTLDDPTTDRATALYYLGEIAIANKNLENAKGFFEKGIEADPNNAFNYAGLGQISLLQGDKSTADSQFKQAVKLDKKNALLLTDIARAFYDADPVKYSKEINKYIADAKKADKKSPAPFILEADMLAPTNVGDAAGYYEMAMNADTELTHPEAYVKYARTYFNVNPRYAIERLQKLLELQPNSALAQRELAEKYYENDQLTLAAEQYGKYIQNPNHFKRDEQRYVGLLYFGKKYDESYQLAGKILAEDPDNFFMKRMRFLNKAAMEDNDGAIDEAEKFFAAEGEFVPNDYTTYGEVLQNLGQDSLAVFQFEKAVEIAPEKVSLLKDLSSAYASARMFEKAAEVEQKFIDAGEFTTNDMLILARRYLNATTVTDPEDPMHAEYAKRATDAVNYVYEKVPDNAQVLMIRARIALASNNNECNEDIVNVFNEALAAMEATPESAQRYRNDRGFIYNQLGKYYLDQKDVDAGREAYTKLYEINPSDGLRDYLEKLK